MNKNTALILKQSENSIAKLEINIGAVSIVTKNQIKALTIVERYYLTKGIKADFSLAFTNVDNIKHLSSEEQSLALNVIEFNVNEYSIAIGLLNIKNDQLLINKEAFDNGFNADLYLVMDKISDDEIEQFTLDECIEKKSHGFVTYDDVYNSSTIDKENNYGKMEHFYVVDKYQFRPMHELDDILDIINKGNDPAEKYSYFCLSGE